MNILSRGLLAAAVIGLPAGAALADQDHLTDAQKQVSESVNVVHKMAADPQLAKLLDNAKGVFIVPDYGKGAAVVGYAGGGGVVLAHQDGKWSDPAFFNMGAVTVGAQVGGAGGAIAMIINDDRALNMFKTQANNFSFNANAGLTVINYSGDAQASGGKGDVVLWTDTKGAFVGASLGVSDINRDAGENTAYYGKKVSPQQILSGQIAASKATSLRTALQNVGK